MKTLSNLEIESMLSDKVRKYYNGFYMRDTLPSTHKKGYYLINIDEDAGMGTHWTLAIITSGKEHNLYFCSFGQPPPDEVLKWLKSNKPNVLYSTSVLQHKRSSSCGYFVVNLMEYLTKKVNKYTATRKLYDFVTKYYTDGDVNDNERLLILRV
jgi:hypothetical protein